MRLLRLSAAPLIKASKLLGLALLAAGLSHGCAHTSDGPADAGAADAATSDGASPRLGDNPISIVEPDAGDIRDADVAPDAFFIDDPPPPVCGPGGSMTEPDPVGGTSGCPSDKNREGCACEHPGEKAACWPGKRINRKLGICKDGMTTCRDTTEFGPTWGPCKGYVLPDESAVKGPEACRCFSGGKWALNNLVPCVFEDGDDVFLYSSHPAQDQGYECNPVLMSPPPKPSESWNQSTLTADCAGQFKLCYTMKAGHADEPNPDDCVITRQCVNVWYEKQGHEQKLPDLPGWTSTDAKCAKRFVDIGGYGEMSVLGTSMECDAVDDGRGHAYVFRRTSYCSAQCSLTPNAAECRACAAGGSGQF